MCLSTTHILSFPNFEKAQFIKKPLYIAADISEANYTAKRNCYLLGAKLGKRVSGNGPRVKFPAIKF